MGSKFSYKAFSIGVFLLSFPHPCLDTRANLLLVGMRSLSSSAGAGRKYGIQLYEKASLSVEKNETL